VTTERINGFINEVSFGGSYPPTCTIRKWRNR